MKNINQSKNESRKETQKESKNTTKKNTTFFNKNFLPKKEESKLGKELNKFQRDTRAKTSRPKYPYKISYSRNFNDYKQIFTDLADINQSKINWAIKLRKEKIMNVFLPSMYHLKHILYVINLKLICMKEIPIMKKKDVKKEFIKEL